MVRASLLVLLCGATVWGCKPGEDLVENGGDGGHDAGARVCPQDPVTSCAYAASDGTCGDVVERTTCVDGAWVCRTGMVPVEQCACLGRPPGNCTCADGGWVCPDAGLPVLTGLTPDELAAMLTAKDFLMIDVHVPYDGDIPGTDTSVPYDDTSALVACIGADTTRKVVLTCRSSSMSQTAGDALVERGYARVSHLLGGMDAWVTSGRTLEHVDGGLPACP